jgi:hypothetical protein
MTRSSHQSKLHVLSIWKSTQRFEHLLCTKTILPPVKTISLRSAYERKIDSYEGPPSINSSLPIYLPVMLDETFQLYSQAARLYFHPASHWPSQADFAVVITICKGPAPAQRSSAPIRSYSAIAIWTSHITSQRERRLRE